MVPVWALEVHLETGSNHDEEVGLVLVFGDGIVELVAQALAEEHDVRLQDGRNGEI